MAFCPSSMITTSSIGHLQRVYFERLARDRWAYSRPELRQYAERLSPVFTVWESLLFIWVLLSFVSGIAIYKGWL